MNSPVRLADDWIGPYWLEHRDWLEDRDWLEHRDAGHPVANQTARNWTTLGNFSSSLKAIVDQRGLVCAWPHGWSLDWWIGADDRWHFPSRDAGTRQRLISSTPVVETAMRVPGGDAVQRVYAVKGDEELLVVELENASTVPFAVALAVRPYNPKGLAPIRRIDLEDGMVLVDGRPALLLPSRPRRMAGSTAEMGDVASIVAGGRAGDELPVPLEDPRGLAHAAFLYPLVHSGTMRVAIPLEPHPSSSSSSSSSSVAGRGRRRHPVRVAPAPVLPDPLPAAASVARSWEAQTRRGMRLDLPSGRLAEAVEANRRFLLLFHEGNDVRLTPSTSSEFSYQDAARLLVALDRYGFSNRTAEVLATYPDRQQGDGWMAGPRKERLANGAALWAMGEHYRLTGDVDMVKSLVPTIAEAARWIEKARHGKSRGLVASSGTGPVGSGSGGASGSGAGRGAGGSAADLTYRDTFWSLRGLLDAVELLDAAGQDAAAVTAVRWASGLRQDLDASLETVAQRLGSIAIPAGPRAGLDQSAVSSLLACYPLNLYMASHPAIAETVAILSERFCVGDAFFPSMDHLGLSTGDTLQLAGVELLAGDRRALSRLGWLLEVASPTFTWPEAVDPQTGAGCFGDGHDGGMAADFCSLVRNLLVRETPDGLALCSLLPDAWLGQGFEVYHAPTHAGLLSYVVRWHNERPALLWELQPRGQRAVRLTVPGLDRTWSSDQTSGEALLSPVGLGVIDRPAKQAAAPPGRPKRRRSSGGGGLSGVSGVSGSSGSFSRPDAGSGSRSSASGALASRSGSAASSSLSSLRRSGESTSSSAALPSVGAARATVARRLRTQGRACGSLGSPLYATLLEKAAADVERGGVIWRALAGHEGDPGPSALGLRFLGSLHRLALAGLAPGLAARYPSCGGDGDAEAAWRDMQEVVEERIGAVRKALLRPVQTNEVGRSAALVGGFLSVADSTGLPLRILEVGASAGLNLRWDHYRYVQGPVVWGPVRSPLTLTNHFARVPALDRAIFRGVAERRGCDQAPVDPTTVDGRLTLLSFVWPDQAERFSRLRAALLVANSVPAPVDRADATEWLADQLAPDVDLPAVATVVFHSVFQQYLTEQGRVELATIIEQAGARATAGQPFAWLRMEPANRTFDVRLTQWPGGHERLLATADAHGRDVNWLE